MNLINDEWLNVLFQKYSNNIITPKLERRTTYSASMKSVSHHKMVTIEPSLEEVLYVKVLGKEFYKQFLNRDFISSDAVNNTDLLYNVSSSVDSLCCY